MHTAGHVGIGFAVATPVSLALDVIGLGGIVVPATAVLVGLSTVPDVDHHLPGFAHRGGTHSLPFTLLVGVLVGALGWLAGPVNGVPSGSVAVVGLAVGALAVGCHLLADLCTPMGVPLAWPRSTTRQSLRVVRSANTRVNLGLLVAGLTIWLVTVGVRLGA